MPPRVSAVPWVRDDGALVLGGGQQPPAPSYLQVDSTMTGLVGHPAVWLDAPAAAWCYGWRITENPWLHDDGTRWGVTVCTDAHWWTATLAGRHPDDVVRLPLATVWLVTYGDRTPA